MQEILAFESVNKIPMCNHSNERYLTVLSCGVVYLAVEGDSILVSVEKSSKV